MLVAAEGAAGAATCAAMANCASRARPCSQALLSPFSAAEALCSVSARRTWRAAYSRCQTARLFSASSYFGCKAVSCVCEWLNAWSSAEYSLLMSVSCCTCCRVATRPREIVACAMCSFLSAARCKAAWCLVLTTRSDLFTALMSDALALRRSR